VNVKKAFSMEILNSTTKILPKNSHFMYFEWANKTNFQACFFITLVGLIGNFCTIYIIRAKPHIKKKSNNIKVNYQFHPGYQTSKKYILALAISDALFLVSNLLENVFPSISPHPLFQLVNTYDVMCKFTLYIRNGSRMCSSYLVVLFAWERYVVIKAPISRLQFHKKKLAKYSIISVYVCSYVLCVYTPFITGLRPIELTTIETSLTSGIYNQYLNVFLYSKYECDTLKGFISFYDHIALVYINIGLLIPVFLISFFNLSIIHVLFTRKSEIFRRTFSTNSKNIKFLRANAEEACSISLTNKSLRSTVHLKYFKSNYISSSNPKLMRSNSMVSIQKRRKEILTETRDYKQKRKSYCFEDDKKLETKEVLVTRSFPTLSRFEFDFRSNVSQSHISTVAKRLKDSDRATLVLILLSVVFIVLNFPYIISWMLFYIPIIRNELNMEQVYLRFAFLNLSEILHLANFTSGLFIYCSVSKLFRKDLKYRLQYAKSCFIRIKT